MKQLHRILAIALLTLLALAFAACGSDPEPVDAGPTEDVVEVRDDLDVVEDEVADEPDMIRPDTNEGPIVCRPCFGATDCGGPNNLCLQLPSGESACGLDCAESEEICPPGSFCTSIGDGESFQCVPENLYCENQCGEPPVECETAGEICDPLSGHCGPPLDLCDACSVDAQCGEGNMCLTFPDVDSYRGCGQACSTDEPCPDSYICASVDEEGLVRQCVPELLTCIDRCSATVCSDGEVCNPLDGVCEPPLEFCDECLTAAQCGGSLDLCVRLLDEAAYCLQDCTTSGQISCPEGTVCLNLGPGVDQCVPTELTCTNHCVDPEPVVCEEDQNCDPLDGVCHQSQVDLCGRPCDNNYECGGQDDMCIRFADDLTGGAFCARACSDEDPCPLGYRCSALEDGLRRQCAPAGSTPSCEMCGDVVCPDGFACRPSDGQCLAEPTPCTEQAHCPVGEICDTFFENHCIPVGLACDFNSFDCGFQMSCSATSIGETGQCLQECSAVPEGCPDTAPACESYHRAFSVCVERGLGRVERCAQLMDWREQVGRPCPTSETDSGCFGTTDTCLEDVVDGVPGYCTQSCDPDPDAGAPCPSGSSCSQVVDMSGDDVTASAAFYCVPNACECMSWPEGIEEGEVDVLQAAIDQFELSRCDLGFFAEERAVAGSAVANDAFRTALVGLVRNEVLYAPHTIQDQLKAANENSASTAITLGADNLGFSDTDVAVVIGTPTFCEAVQGLFEEGAEDLPACETLTPLEEQLPEAMRAEVAATIAAAGWAVGARRSVFLDTTVEDFDRVTAQLATWLDGGLESAAGVNDVRDFLLNFKYGALYSASSSVADLIDSADLSAGEADVSGVDISIETPAGLIVIKGSGDDVYCASECGDGTVIDSHVLLFIELGGNDSYTDVSAATSDYDLGISIFVDVAGDDTYDGGEALSLGASQGGIALQFDWGGGADTYTGEHASQGVGLLGVGVLSDDGCTAEECVDTFTSETAAQGVGLFGIGLAFIGDGASTFEADQLAQGAAGPMGAGLLINIAGNDQYTATTGDEGDDPIHPAPARIRSTVGSRNEWSVAQGASVGIAADVPADGGNMSGGVGVLIDLAGDDEYSAGLLGQGAGYWHGLGILLDADGADRYETHGFGLGSGLDFGAGILADHAGDDQYNDEESTARSVLGSGYNFGLGVLVEEDGDDTYYAGSQSLGVGFLNGAGLFLEQLGNDQYDGLTSEETLGKATLSVLGSEPADNPRREARTIGLFVDSSGADTYPAGDVGAPSSDSYWTRTTRVGAGEDSLFEWGMGGDDVGGSGVSSLLDP